MLQLRQINVISNEKWIYINSLLNVLLGQNCLCSSEIIILFFPIMKIKFLNKASDNV